MVYISKQNTHTHTHQTLKKRLVNQLSLIFILMKISDIPPPFFKTASPILPTLCFYVKNLNPHLFFENFKKVGSNYALSFQVKKVTFTD